MQESILSIVMPCLNGMPHLPAAIESVRCALPAGHFEIVVADGGSTDGTLDFLRGAGVRLIESPDRSLYEGLNKAIAQARGDYVAWLNSDDLLLPAMAELWRLARQENADVASGEAEIAKDGTVVWTSDHHVRPMDFTSILFAVPTVNSRLVHVGLLRECGSFRSDIGLGADRYMLLRLARHSRKRISLASSVYRYNAHAGSKTMAASWRSYQDVHEANLQLASVLRNELDCLAEVRQFEAFASLSALGHSRAQFFGGRRMEGLMTALKAIRENASPSVWLQVVSYYRRYRGLGSGW